MNNVTKNGSSYARCGDIIPWSAHLTLISRRLPYYVLPGYVAPWHVPLPNTGIICFWLCIQCGNSYEREVEAISHAIANPGHTFGIWCHEHRCIEQAQERILNTKKPGLPGFFFTFGKVGTDQSPLSILKVTPQSLHL